MPPIVRKSVTGRVRVNPRSLLLELLLAATVVGASTRVAADDRGGNLAAALKGHVRALTGTAEPRNYQAMDSLDAAAGYIEGRLKACGLTPVKQEFVIQGKTFRNIVARIGNGSKKTVIVGAHYDVWGPGPGADDNASGVAGLLELARLANAHKAQLACNVEIVAYANEEPPFFRTNQMGSYVHAQSWLNRKSAIDHVIVLEMIGYFSGKDGSQAYPLQAMKQAYPTAGDFIAVVGNIPSSPAAERIKQAVLKNSKIGCQTLIGPPALKGIDFSDHLNYWALGLTAVMVTDTSFYRNPNYHKKSDTPETLDYQKMGEVVKGIAASLRPDARQ